MDSNTLNRIIDIANTLPIPRQLLAYPLDLCAYLCGDAPAGFLVPAKELDRLHLSISGLDIERMLRAKGIRMWGHFVMPPPINDIMFTVPRTKWRWAAYLLKKAGIPYQ